MTVTKPDVPVARVRIDSLTAHPQNAREGDVGAIVQSLLEFGQFRPIVVQTETPEGEARRVVIAGTHTWLAHRAILDNPDLEPDVKARFESIDIAGLVISDKDALRIMLADNRTHDLGRDRPDMLAAVLTDLGYDGMLGTGFEGEDLDTILRDLGKYDPGANIADGFAGIGTPLSERAELLKGRDQQGNEFFALHLSLTHVQRERLLAAFKRAKEQGYATQPEALEAMARKYMED